VSEETLKTALPPSAWLISNLPQLLLHVLQKHVSGAHADREVLQPIRHIAQRGPEEQVYLVAPSRLQVGFPSPGRKCAPSPPTVNFVEAREGLGLRGRLKVPVPPYADVRFSYRAARRRTGPPTTARLRHLSLCQRSAAGWRKSFSRGMSQRRVVQIPEAGASRPLSSAFSLAKRPESFILTESAAPKGYGDKWKR
jgi:hypothetical protein